ncbi:sensor domain-containing diguanylate cyclase [Paraburkholderia sp. BL10I2N1]|uniref:sensor domain-containing diguanylate cyclase n=1 Tax=Paraburkholderia sp. BL10I2N1 TaxID=1938796 RepID=UPI00105CC01C|nr:sensor domain-containing diguanylate cyclase [Paraburkholderia sp. BL10I2N1]TDN68265.1 diguanylate cyclase (GGDEF)-like protein [Paraburkholderia sp. BL10I2N1]
MVTRRPNAVIVISLVLAAAILAISAWVLFEMRKDALRRAQESAFNVSLLVERDTSRNLDIYDLSLQAVIEGVRQPGVMALPPPIRQMVLFDRSATAKDLGSLLVVDEKGDIIVDSQAVPARRVNVADRDYFQVHRASPTVGLYVSHPFMPRLSSGTVSIALSRRLSHPDGSFAGIVVGTMRLNYFRKLFDGVNLGEGGSMALMLADGTMLMRRPYDAQITGRSLQGTANYTRFTEAPSGDFFGTAAIDGVARWYAYRHIAGYPMILDVAIATGDIYTEWRRRAWIIGSLVTAVDVALVALAVLFAQQLRRRIAVEEELRMLARTDGLTGLNNRRAFEEIIEAEWRRTQRSARPLSMLLIDVDNFKGFNDLYGHSAGDDALVAVARCIAGHVRRPGDSAVRYGGEEFVALLPDTGEAGAMRIAEQIRAAVQSLGMRHVASAHHVLTISIGIASTERQRFGTCRAFVNAADTALYEAKGAGRNRVVVWPVEARAEEPQTVDQPAG